MKFHELACSFMSLHAVSWACMQFISLSEQLTRISQCLFWDTLYVNNIEGKYQCWQYQHQAKSMNIPDKFYLVCINRIALSTMCSSYYLYNSQTWTHKAVYCIAWCMTGPAHTVFNAHIRGKRVTNDIFYCDILLDQGHGIMSHKHSIWHNHRSKSLVN